MAEVAIPRRLFQEILRPQPPPHQHETFDSHAFDSNRREERAQNAWKNGQISPPDAARVRGMVAAVGTAHPTLRKGRQNVNIHANSRFIWGIPDKALFQGGQGLQYLFEGFVLDTDRRELRRGVEPVAVEPQVFDLLTFLIQNRERVVSKDEMIQAVWGGRIVSESALGARINAVRSAVGDNGEDQRVVKTFPRKGIRFIAPAHEQQTAAPTVVSQQVPTPSLVDKPSIAVLPFSNMSGDPEQDYFADGMAEEIITALSRCKWLFVIARNSSFAYKGRAIDIRQVGRELGVRYVLEGSVRRSGNRLRFVGQLIDATNGAHLWADRFDGELTDVFELQDSLTESVVAAIEPNLQRAEVERLKNKPAENLDAYDLLLRAQQLEHALTQESVDAALRCLERALVLAPAYAPAMALAAYCYATRYSQGWSKDAEAEAAEGLRLANGAVTHGEDDGNVLWLAAWTVLRLSRDLSWTKELAQRSLLHNPNSPMALSIAAWVEVHYGNTDRALQLISRAERLNPRDPRGWFTASAKALAYFARGEFDEACNWARKAAVSNPRSGMTLRLLAASLVQAGQKDQAIEVVQQFLKIEPDFTISKWLSRHISREADISDKLVHAFRVTGIPE